jgi:hypothetical protein
MDPVAIVSLIATCASLAARTAQVANNLDDFVKIYQAVDRSISGLVTRLRLFGESLTQLQRWLASNCTVSPSLKATIQSSVQDFCVVLDNLGKHVEKVQPSEGNDRAGLKQRLTHLWNSKNIERQERQLHSQLQTVMMLINLVKL